MALVNPNIAMGFRGVEMPRQNMLADYAAVQQIQSGQRQGEAAQMQIDKMRREESGLDQMMATITAKGGPSDPMVAADAMIKSKIPQYMEMGFKLQNAARQRAEDMAAMGLSPTAAPAAAAPVSEPYEGYNESIGMPAPTNALAPTAAMPAAPVNAMAPVAAAPSVNAMAPSADRDAQIRQAKLKMLSPTAGVREAGKMELEKLLAPPPFRSVAAGASVLGPDNKVIFTAPAAAPTPLNVSRLIKERDALPPGDPNIAIYNDAIRKETQFAPRAITNVNLPSQEKAEQVERGKMLVDQYKDISKAAGLAAKTLPSLDANLAILGKGFSTGFGTETVAAGAKVLAALGVAEADKFATNAQVFQAKATEAVLQKQLEQKGPQTESDAQRIDQIGAQLGKTTAGNKFVLTTAKEQLKRDMEQRDFYDKWRTKNKTYDGAEDAWYSGEGGKSLFDRPALKTYAQSESKLPKRGAAAPASEWKVVK